MPASARSIAASPAFGGFDHNAQTLRVVTALERRYPAFDGLNLTWETLEGLVKHNGPLTDRDGNAVGRYRERGVPQRDRRLRRACRTSSCGAIASAEAQVAAIADDIAYDAHDIDDGLRAELFALDDLAGVPLLGEHPARRSATSIRHSMPARLAHELVRRLIAPLIEDVIAETSARARRRWRRARPTTCAHAGAPVGRLLAGDGGGRPRHQGFPLDRACIAIARVMRIMDEAERVVRDLFARFLVSPQDMPAEWAQGARRRRRGRRARAASPISSPA